MGKFMAIYSKGKVPEVGIPKLIFRDFNRFFGQETILGVHIGY